MGKHGIRIPQTYAPRFRDPNIEKWTRVSVNISASLWNMWTGHVSRVNYLQTSCYPMRTWSGVWICENVLCHHAIWGKFWKVGLMSDWNPYHAGKRLSGHMSLYWLHSWKTATFQTKRRMMKCWIFPNTLIQCGRCYIIGSRIVPSSQKLATFCHHPTMQIEWQVKNRSLNFTI